MKNAVKQYLLIKSPPASGKSRALMFIALNKLENQGLKQALIIVPERSTGASFANEPLSEFVTEEYWQTTNATPNNQDYKKIKDGTLKKSLINKYGLFEPQNLPWRTVRQALKGCRNQWSKDVRNIESMF